MLWNRKYWDILEQLYWTPKYLGLSSISQKKWEKKDGFVCVPEESVNKSGPLYTRGTKSSDLREKLLCQEEPLNHVFDLTFAIAGDAVFERLFCEPLDFEDNGPFESLGRETNERYGWGKSENVTQHDGLYITPRSIIGTELKLGSTSWPEQIAKYAALFLSEEKVLGKRENIGIVFVLPESSLAGHWKKCGLDGPRISSTFIGQLKSDDLPKRIRGLLEEESDSLRDVFDRMRLAAITWAQLKQNISEIESVLDMTSPGDQTLLKLLSGFRAQIEEHSGTEVSR